MPIKIRTTRLPITTKTQNHGLWRRLLFVEVLGDTGVHHHAVVVVESDRDPGVLFWTATVLEDADRGGTAVLDNDAVAVDQHFRVAAGDPSPGPSATRPVGITPDVPDPDDRSPRLVADLEAALPADDVIQARLGESTRHLLDFLAASDALMTAPRGLPAGVGGSPISAPVIKRHIDVAGIALGVSVTVLLPRVVVRGAVVRGIGNSITIGVQP